MSKIYVDRENSVIVGRYAVKQYEGQEEIADDAEELKPTPQEVHRGKLEQLNADAEAQLAAIRAKYPLSEILSWPKQEAEARAHVVGKGADTPLLSAMAEIRGMTLDELAGRVIGKADVYTALVAQVIGNRQKAEDELERG